MISNITMYLIGRTLLFDLCLTHQLITFEELWKSNFERKSNFDGKKGILKEKKEFCR